MVSLDTLDEDQKDKLAQYQTITQIQDLEEALGQLLEHEWNLERAIQHVYENSSKEKENREALEEEVASTTAPAGTTNNNTTASAPIPPRPRYGAISIPLTNRMNARRPSLILTILFWPFGMAWNITWSILSFASRMMSRPTIAPKKRDPRVLAVEFIEQFEQNYGRQHIEFFKGGYSQALEKARKDLKFMLVLLHSEDHDDTKGFCRDTLTAELLIDYIKEKNILVWGGNVHESEAHKVSSTLQASTYPFMALIALQDSNNGGPKMTVIERIEGPSHAAELVSQIDHAIDRHGAVMNRLKHERNQRELERQLRVDQDAAYHQSLKADQEKARKMELEKQEQKEREEQQLALLQQKQLQQQKREQYVHYLLTEVKKEPELGDGPVAKLSFRLPDGERVVRTFSKDATLDALYRFVEVYPLLNDDQVEQVEEVPLEYEHKYNFTIHSPYPRMEYEPDQTKKICDIKSLWPSATLVVDTVDEDEEDV